MKDIGIGSIVVCVGVLWFCCGLLYETHIKQNSPRHRAIAWLASPVLVVAWLVEWAVRWTPRIIRRLRRSIRTHV
jgi:protein-S-isoprenylcysteine O-methyltransferase Ste14